VVDHKLQLELVPYGSTSFATRGFTPEVLGPHFGRILATIAVVPRRYVLFCGAVCWSWMVRGEGNGTTERCDVLGQAGWGVLMEVLTRMVVGGCAGRWS
jgi:hypothetical protein